MRLVVTLSRLMSGGDIVILTFSHMLDGERVPLLDAEGREVTLSVDAADRTTAMNSEGVKTFITGLVDKTDIRVRGVS